MLLTLQLSFNLTSGFPLNTPQLPVLLPEGSLPAVQKLKFPSGNSGFVLGEAPHCPGGGGVLHSEDNADCHILSRVIDVILTGLTECILLCGLKIPL